MKKYEFVLKWTLLTAKLGCAAGLAALESRKYKLAARKFTELGVELGNSYEEVISPQDVAVYGGLCALASLDRAELKGEMRERVVEVCACVPSKCEVRRRNL